MRRVIAGDTIDRSVGKGLYKQVDIYLRSEGWLDFKAGVKFADMIFDKGKVHGTNFTGDRGPQEFRLADHFHGPPSADSHDVKLTAGMER